MVWIGYYIDWATGEYGLSESRGGWLAGWLRDRVREGYINLDDLAGVLGRISFCMAPPRVLAAFRGADFRVVSRGGQEGKIAESVVYCFPLPGHC